MTVSGTNNEVKQLRSIIHDFINSRLQGKLDKLKPDEVTKRAELIADHEPDTWLADAASRANQIQLATHTLKAIHPDARGSVVNLRESICQEGNLVGTHSLRHKTADVVGNAAALDVFKLLKLEFENASVLDRLLSGDAAIRAALADEPEVAEELATKLCMVAEGNSVRSSHSLAKQLYFLLPDGGYHLLAPLFPTALVQDWHVKLQDDRFSEETKTAREARKNDHYHENGYRDYPNLAVLSFGGSKPQNISQLNSERGGKAYLLSSAPPVWVSRDVRPPRGESIFDGAFSSKSRVRVLTKELRELLFKTRDKTITDDNGQTKIVKGPNNFDIRTTRAGLVLEIIDELLTYVAALYTLPSGWSLKRYCELSLAQRLWLDPYAKHDEEDRLNGKDWPVRVSNDFALWLNSAIRTDETPMGDDERIAWKHEIKVQIETLARDLKEMSDDN